MVDGIVVAVGMVAWNEEGSIALTIDSVFQQQLFARPPDGVAKVELVILANGCTDRTVERAQAAIDRNLAACGSKRTGARVIDIKAPGRANAWNRFVHEWTDRETKYIFFMDADIVITNPRAMLSMVEGLEKEPRKHVATATGTKDNTLKPRMSLWDRMTVGVSNMEKDARLMYVNGQLYCGRSSFFRSFLFPPGFVCGDDSFIATMATTNLLTTGYEWDRICYPEDARYVFEAYTHPLKLFKQHRRRAVGLAVRMMMVDYVKTKQKDGQPNGGEIIRSLTATDSEWLLKYTRERVREAGFWVIPLKTGFHRVDQWKRSKGLAKVKRLPLMVLGTVWAVGVAIAGNLMFRKGTYLGAWQINQNTRMVEGAGTGAPASTVQVSR